MFADCSTNIRSIQSIGELNVYVAEGTYKTQTLGDSRFKMCFDFISTLVNLFN